MAAPFIGPSRTMGAVVPDRCSAPVKVMVFQWPWGTGARHRSPFAGLDIEARHLDRSACLINKKKQAPQDPDRIGPRTRLRAYAARRDAAARWRARFFLKVIARRSSQHRMVAGTTRRPHVSANRSAISTSVMSLSSSIIARMKPSCGSSTAPKPDPCGLGNTSLEVCFSRT
jgi:hypothetical protein